MNHPHLHLRLRFASASAARFIVHRPCEAVFACARPRRSVLARFVGVLLWSLATHALASPTAMPVTAIDRVVVFADRAEVRRVAQAPCKGDAGEVAFANLPASLDVRTLRAETSEGAVAVGVAVRTQERRTAADPRVKELQDEVRALEQEIVNRQRAQADDDDRVRMLAGYDAWFRTALGEELRQEKPDVARFESFLSMLLATRSTTVTTRVARVAEVRALKRRREQAERKLAWLSAHTVDVAPDIAATVSVRCSPATTPQVFLSYVVPGASWQPEYDLRFVSASGKKTGAGRVTVTVATTIRQATGEDWTDAEMWLSTAKPRLGGEAPLPQPLWVKAAPVTKEKTLVQAQEDRPASLAPGGAQDAVAPRVGVLDDGGKSMVWKLPRRVTVQADGRPSWFPLDEFTGKGDASLVAVPSLTGAVHRVVTFANPAPYPLLAGVVHVFRHATYLSDQSIGYRAPSEKVELSLGVDDDIKLVRIDLTGGVRSKAFLSGRHIVSHGMRTQLHNRSTEDVVVELREQVPVTKTADIEVVIGKEKTTAGYRLDEHRGHLAWSVAMAKGATAHRDLSFSISLPGDWLLDAR
jgi:uncharacterized protein (TIGR02231 family)